MASIFREGGIDGIIQGYIEDLAARITDYRGSDFYSVASGAATASGDFDGDGKQDIVYFLSEWNGQTGVTSGPTLGQMIFLKGGGDGTFSDATSTLVDNGEFNAYVRKLRVGDFNGDGIDDVIVASNREDGRFADAAEQTAPQVAFFSNGNTLVKQDLDFTTWGHALSAGDLNSDGKDDFFVSGFTADPDGTGAAYFLQGENGELTKYFSDIVQGKATAIGDFDGDGTTEMADIRTLYVNGLPAATGMAELKFDGNALVETNFFSDGEIKRLLVAPGWNSNEELYVIKEDANGTEFVDVGLQDIQVGDINGDGKDDLVGMRFAGSLVYDDEGVYDFRNSVSLEHFEFFTAGSNGKLQPVQYKVEGWTPTPYGVLDFQLIDFDSDGHLDIFIGSGSEISSDFVGPQVLFNDGTGNFYEIPGSKMPSFSNNGWITGIPLDANSDGKMDIYYANSSGTSDWDGWKTDVGHIYFGTQNSFAGPDFTDPSENGAAGFNEHYYLNQYSDARQAVKDGSYANGLAHFLAVGRDLGYFGFARNTRVFGSENDDAILLREGNETVLGFGGDDTITGGAGNDVIDGNDGIDVAIFSGNSDRYTIVKVADRKFTITDTLSEFGHDSLTNVEYAQFDDGLVVLNRIPMVAVEIADREVLEETSFSFAIGPTAFLDEDGGSLSYTATLADGGELPSWLTFNSATRTFSGTPLNDHVGTIAVKVTASDGSASVSDTFDLTVANTNDAPTVASTIADQSATEDHAFSFQFNSDVFTDVDAGTTLTYAATLANGGELPSWLTFNSATRTFSGTPLNGHVGTIAVRVTVSDGSASVSDTFDLTVANTNDAPTGANKTATIEEDKAYTFEEGDFGFADAGGESDSLSGIMITVLPDSGRFTRNGSDVQINDVISAADLGQLVWTPGKDTHGDSLARFSFKVIDDGGTDNSGMDTAISANTFIFNVNEVTDVFTGTKSANTFKGTADHDVFNGKGGNDKLTGLGGSDTFIFSKGYDRDTINDFAANGADQDVIDLSDLNSISNMKDLKANHITERGNNVWIDGGSGDVLILIGVDKNDIGKGDVLF